MKNATLSVMALALACCYTIPAFAQYDSTLLDVGYLHLKKDFTQTITIKGADLEKMPFTNLSDAIAAWFYGAYTQPVTLQYVVDGNPVSDVNAYSVYDIEEVVLVQNAAAAVNTADGQQEMVIVRTRRGQGKSGMTADAQTGLVNVKEYGQTSITRVYHNYYLAAWQNLDKVSFGVSGNYQRDVFPVTYSVTTPDNLQRWRLNGYFTWRPNSRNQVEIMLNYTPEQMAAVYGNTGTYPSLDDDHSKQRFILPRLLWHSELSPKWTNDLQATYVHSTVNGSDNNFFVEGPTDSLQGVYNGTSNMTQSEHLWVRDHLGYTATAGHWSIEPAINASYEHVNDQNSMSLVESMYAYQAGVPGPGPLLAATSQANIKEDMVVLTPALDISYKRVLDVQSGVLVDAGKQKANNGREAFPFASLSFDVLRLANNDAASRLKVFGSYAQRAAPSPQWYALADLNTNGYSLLSNSPTQNYNTNSLNGLAGYAVPIYPASHVYWVWETGASYTGWKDRLTIQYTYERRNFVKTYLVVPPNGAYSILYPEWTSTLQHVDVRVKVLDAEGVHWLTGVNVTLLRNSSPSMYANLSYLSNVYDKQDVGDDSPNPHSWTGGWVNRVEVRHFTAGFDLLYHFGESVQSATNLGRRDTIKVNSVITPNIYIGYRWRLSTVRALEFFVESRGLIRNSGNDLLDERRYYTVGGKMSI